MAITAGPFVPGVFCRVTWGFSIGRYGWTESFIRQFGSAGFIGVEASSVAVAKLRMAMCGGGVFMDTIRLSDIAVRRDADDNAVDYRALRKSDTSGADFNFTNISTALDSPSYNPNICVVLRTEGENKVYHGQHALGGMPADLFTSDERLQSQPLWDQAYARWQNKLITDGYGFLALNREPPSFSDIPIDFIDHASKTAGGPAIPGTWVVGDQIRIINAVVEGKRRGGSIVGRITAKTATTFTYQLADTIPLNAFAGPATIAHKEATAFVPLVATQPEYASHRNRGRPLFSPRGRRSRK